MKKVVHAALAAVLFLAASAAQTAAAQALAGRDLPDRPRVGISYYKVPPGRHDEWLRLYQQWHRPIMDAQIAHGTTISSTLYALRSHHFDSKYDFAIISVSPATPKPMPVSRGALIRRLFPDIEAYVVAERRRWELTIDHADSSLLELDITDPNLSIYYPILDGRIITE